MKNTAFILSLLILSTCSMKLSWKDLQKAAGWGSSSNTFSSWSSGGSSGSGSGSGSGYTLVQNSASINGKGAQDLLAIYLKQLIILLSNTDNEIRVVRLEVDCTGENYKVLIRIMDCNGNKIYIGMLVHVCNGEISIVKFFQSNDAQDIINAFGFLDGTLYNYPDGNIGNSCSNSILDMLSEFCSAIGGGSSSQGWSVGSSNNGGLAPLNGGNSWGGNSSSASGEGIKLHIKIPGAQNPTGKTILLGSPRP